MTPPLLLSAAEVAELSGYTRPSRQIAWLHRQGIPHYVAADGHPRVVRDALLQSKDARPKGRNPELRL